mgnify:CR=1 FL=1
MPLALYAILGVLGYFAYTSYSDSEKKKADEAKEKAANDLKRGWKPMLATRGAGGNAYIDAFTDINKFAQAGTVSLFFGLKNDAGPNPVVMAATGKILKTDVDHGPGMGDTGTRFWTIQIIESSVFSQQVTAMPTGTVVTPAPLPPPALGAIFMVRDADFQK